MIAIVLVSQLSKAPYKFRLPLCPLRGGGITLVLPQDSLRRHSAQKEIEALKRLWCVMLTRHVTQNRTDKSFEQHYQRVSSFLMVLIVKKPFSDFEQDNTPAKSHVKCSNEPDIQTKKIKDSSVESRSPENWDPMCSILQVNRHRHKVPMTIQWPLLMKNLSVETFGSFRIVETQTAFGFLFKLCGVWTKSWFELNGNDCVMTFFYSIANFVKRADTHRMRHENDLSACS